MIDNNKLPMTIVIIPAIGNKKLIDNGKLPTVIMMIPAIGNMKMIDNSKLPMTIMIIPAIGKHEDDLLQQTSVGNHDDTCNRKT